MSDGIKSGRELDTVEFEIENIRQRADEQRLGQARHADQQTMTPGEEGDQDFFDDLVLADDDLANLADHGIPFGGNSSISAISCC